jgi:hypothetical protein
MGSLKSRTAQPFEFDDLDSFSESFDTFFSSFVTGLSAIAGPALRKVSERRLFFECDGLDIDMNLPEMHLVPIGEKEDTVIMRSTAHETNNPLV